MTENKETLDNVLPQEEVMEQVNASEQEVINQENDVEAADSSPDNLQTAADYIEYLKSLMAQEQPERGKIADSSFILPYVLYSRRTFKKSAYGLCRYRLCPLGYDIYHC